MTNPRNTTWSRPLPTRPRTSFRFSTTRASALDAVRHKHRAVVIRIGRPSAGTRASHPRNDVAERCHRRRRPRNHQKFDHRVGVISTEDHEEVSIAAKRSARRCALAETASPVSGRQSSSKSGSQARAPQASGHGVFCTLPPPVRQMWKLLSG